MIEKKGFVNSEALFLCLR